MSTVESVGVAFIQATRIRLAEIDGPLLTLELTTNQTSGPDGFVVPGVETVDADLVSTGYGTAIWALTVPLPVEASSTADQALTGVLAIDGERAALDQVMTTSQDTGISVAGRHSSCATDHTPTQVVSTRKAKDPSLPTHSRQCARPYVPIWAAHWHRLIGPVRFVGWLTNR